MIKLRTFRAIHCALFGLAEKTAEIQGWPDGGVVTQRTANPTASHAKLAFSAKSLPFWRHGFVPSREGDRAHAVDEPFRTITGAHRGEIALQSAAMLKLRNNSYGEDAEAPMGAVTAGGLHHGVVAASLVRQFGKSNAADVEQPMPTIVAGGGGKTLAMAAFLAQHNTERGVRVNPGQPVDKPVSTITGRGTQQQVVQTTLVEAGELPDDVMERAVQVAALRLTPFAREEFQGAYHQSDDEVERAPNAYGLTKHLWQHLHQSECLMRW